MMRLQVFPSVLCVHYFSLSPAAVALNIYLKYISLSQFSPAAVTLRRAVDLRELLAVVRSLAPAPANKDPGKKKRKTRRQKAQDPQDNFKQICLSLTRPCRTRDTGCSLSQAR